MMLQGSLTFHASRPHVSPMYSASHAAFSVVECTLSNLRRGRAQSDGETQSTAL